MDLSKITASIPKEISEWGEKNATNRGYAFVGMLSYRYGEIVERTFAIRRYAKKGVLITEVRRRATGDTKAIVKNLLFSQMGGYIPVFEREDKYHRSYGWNLKAFNKTDFDVWYEASLPLNFYTLYLNVEMLTEIDEFKHCGYSCGDVIDYLNKYRQNPMVEYFGKLDLPLSSALIFKAFLLKNVSDVRSYGTQATIYAYNHNMSISDASAKIDKERRASKSIPALRGTKLNKERIVDYCNANSIGFRVYNDYLNAVIGIGLDLEDTKNIYPKDFTAMHDLRISEYESLKAKADREKQKKLYESFAKAGEKATAYEYTDNEYTLIAPRDISELKTEGAILEHCVGRMGYDKKMADGQIVIMFLRHSNDITAPFVTIEYDLKQLKLLQAYAKKNSTPPSDAMEFIDKWQQFMKGEQYEKIHA